MSDTERPQAVALARQILDDRSDLGWLAPLAREFQNLVKREQRIERDEEKLLMLKPLLEGQGT